MGPSTPDLRTIIIVADSIDSSTTSRSPGASRQHHGHGVGTNNGTVGNGLCGGSSVDLERSIVQVTRPGQLPGPAGVVVCILESATHRTDSTVTGWAMDTKHSLAKTLSSVSIEEIGHYHDHCWTGWWWELHYGADNDDDQRT